MISVRLNQQEAFRPLWAAESDTSFQSSLQDETRRGPFSRQWIAGLFSVVPPGQFIFWEIPYWQQMCGRSLHENLPWFSQRGF